MRDIRYKWNEGPNSVGVSSEVSLPQFKVLGHRQRAMEISLTTGTCRRIPIFPYIPAISLFQIQFYFNFMSLFYYIPLYFTVRFHDLSIQLYISWDFDSIVIIFY